MSKGSSVIHVAHVVLSLDVGGLERVVVSLINGVDRSRFRPSLCCLEKEGRLADEVRDSCAFIAVMHKGPGVAFGLPFRLARLFRAHDVDVIHCHNFGPFLYGSFGGRLARCRSIVYTVHGPDVSSKTSHIRYQRMPFFDRIIAVSEHVRRGIIKRVRVDPVDVTTIVNGIDVTRFSGGGARTRCREEFGVPDGSRLIGVVARLTPEKDHATLLEAFAIVSAQRSDVVLAIVGDGPTLAEAKETARRLGIEGLVRFTGSRLDVPDILSAFDLFAMSSKEEGLGITLIEAMAAGLPVVATAAGGIPEIVQDGVTGFIVPPGDSQGFADALLRGLSDDVRGREMGEAGRRRAVERFSLTRMIGDYEKVYAELAAR